MDIEKIKDFDFEEIGEDEIEELAHRIDLFVYRVRGLSWPYILIWDSCSGEGIKISEEEGEFHLFKDLMAALVEKIGDCRGAEISSMTLESGMIEQHCKKCGDSWTVG